MKPEQFKEITEWQTATFGQATALSKAYHLDEEVDELISDLYEKNNDRRLEFADCFLLLFDCASSDGMTYEDICDAIDEKMKINYGREWGKSDANGVVKHKKH